MMRIAPLLLVLLLLAPALAAQVTIVRENGSIRATNAEPARAEATPAPGAREASVVAIEQPAESDPIPFDAAQVRRFRAYASWVIFAPDGGVPFAVETSGAGPIPLRFHDSERQPLDLLSSDSIPWLVREVNRTFSSGSLSRPEGVDPLPYELHFSLGADPRGWRKTVPVYRSVRFRDVFEGVDQTVTPGEIATVVAFRFDAGADVSGIHLSYPRLDSIGPVGSFSVRSSYGPMAQPGARFTYEDGTEEAGARLELLPHRMYASIHLGSLRPQPLSMSFTMMNQWRPVHGPPDDPLANRTVIENGGAVAAGADGSVVSATSGFIERHRAIATLYPGALSGPLTIRVAVVTKTGSGGEIEWVSILGGSSYGSSTSRFSVAIDAKGRSFVAGPAFAAPDFPFTTGEKSGNAFVARIGAGGELEASAATVAGEEGPAGIALAADGRLACIASTVEPSREGSVVKGAPRPGGADAGTADAYVACFDLQQEATPLAYAGFVGGTGDDRAEGIAAGARGALYVTGMTTSNAFPASARGAMKTMADDRDAFVTLLDTARAGAGSLVASTYFGSRDDPMGFTNESVDAIAIAPDGGVWIAGESASVALVGEPLGKRGHGLDVYLAGFTADLARLERAVAFGSGGNDHLASLAIDGRGNFYLAGIAGAADFPLVASAHAGEPRAEHYFATKINSAASSIVWSTLLGSASRPHTTGERDLGIAVDADGTVWIPVLAYALPGKTPFQPWQLLGGLELLAVGRPSTAAQPPRIESVVFDESRERWKIMGSGLAGSDVLANGAALAEVEVERDEGTIFIGDAEGLRRIDVVNEDGQSATAFVPARRRAADVAEEASGAEGSRLLSLPIIGGLLLIAVAGFFVAKATRGRDDSRP